MGPSELAYRFREKGRSELERIGVGADDPITADWKSGAPRFYTGNPERLREFFQNRFPEWIDRAVAEAEGLCRHEVELLSHGPVAIGRQIDWHRDPFNGRIWERRFWADYCPEHDSSGRDVKVIHELNRHQHLPRLAKIYVLTGNERYAAEAVSQLESWIHQNPPGLGINWHSSLEIGIRAISWLWTIFLILPSRSLDEAAAGRIGKSLLAQLEHVYRYTSVYSSPNTHLIGEATALFIAGLVFRDQKRPAAWLERGAALLAEEADKQVLDDGVYGELSSYYHCYALDFYLRAMVLAERNRYHLPERVRRKVCDMLGFLMHLTRPDGAIPLLGDDDGGRALALQQRNYRSFRDALCLGAVLYLREDFKYQAGAFSEEALWLLGEDAWEVYRLLGSEPPAHTQAFFPSAGYVIQRSGWGPLDSHLVFDCGGLGMLSGGHAHADALSVTLFSGGRELLVDPGTCVYNGAPEWREYFRSTRAHNTVTIDNLDQAEPAGTFRWKTKFCSRVARDAQYVEAEHDGYAQIGMTHRRRLLQIPPDYWIVVDDFRGSGEHTFDFYYHLAPDLAVSSLQQDEAELVVSAEPPGLLLGLYASWPLKTEILCGWVSCGYGDKKPGSTVRATLTGPAPAAAMTLLAPPATGAVLRRLPVEEGNAIAWSYSHRGFEDLAVLSTGDSEIRVADFRMQGEFFWLRLESGALKRAITIRAGSLNHNGRNVLEDALCAPSAGS